MELEDLSNLPEIEEIQSNVIPATIQVDEKKEINLNQNESDSGNF
ncbi:MAG: hypothetical protein CM15mP104_3730 [Gammaproteobacteria bacterium]|nr:MAG: hypothetical protein CM15mP104_3730 [Gammaproteobacteria bacterium]